MIVRADVCKLPFADQSVDLVFGSPPYCDARTYDDGTLPEGHVVSRDCQEWIDWMLEVTTECLRVSRGAVVWVIGSVTRGRDYWPAPEGLAYQWWRQGGSAYRPVFWHRIGIPGSGGDQWFRSDVEFIQCFKRHGSLPWADNTAMGHKPRWEPGGKLSYRDANGKRRHKIRGTSGYSGGDARDFRASEGNLLDRAVTEIANPGNVIKTNNGGGHLGDSRAHENEAPFPEKLAEWFILSLCPPGGIVLDPFSGSGTTAKVAKQHGRIGIGSDIRTSQCKLTSRRTKSVQRALL